MKRRMSPKARRDMHKRRWMWKFVAKVNSRIANPDHRVIVVNGRLSRVAYQ